MKLRRSSRSPGVALISALMVMVILVIIASGFVQLTARDVRSSQTSGDTLMTLYLAEAGIEYALWATKHNMNVYPAAAYDVDPTDANTGSTARGGVISLLQPATGNTQEHVLINDLAYGGDNWLGNVSYCGTFEVQQTFATLTGNIVRVTIVSTGRVRQVPAGWNWETGNLAAELASGSTSVFKNVRSQRTLNATFDLDLNTGATTPVDSKASAVREAQWYEKFR